MKQIITISRENKSFSISKKDLCLILDALQYRMEALNHIQGTINDSDLFELAGSKRHQVYNIYSGLCELLPDDSK